MTAPTKAPQAHDGPHYANPSSKPVRGPVSPADRADVQRFTWKLLFILLLGVLALGAVLTVVTRS